MNFNLQFNRECLKYKALRMTFGRGPFLPQNCLNSSKTSVKTTIVTLKVHDMNRKRFNISRYLFHGTMYKRGWNSIHVFLKAISIVVNHCVTLLRYVVTWWCVNIGKTTLLPYNADMVKLNSPFCKTLSTSLNSSSNLSFILMSSHQSTNFLITPRRHACTILVQR